MSDIEWT